MRWPNRGRVNQRTYAVRGQVVVLATKELHGHGDEHKVRAEHAQQHINDCLDGTERFFLQ